MTEVIVENNVILESENALLQEKSDWFYRFAKKYGPQPQRQNWRTNRSGWKKWLFSADGQECIRMTITTDESLYQSFRYAFRDWYDADDKR